MYLQAALCQCFERMSHALRWGCVSLRDGPLTGNERLFLKVGSSRAYEDYDQEQGEHPLQPGAVRLNKFFPKEKAHKLFMLDICFNMATLFTFIAVVIFERLQSNHLEDSQALIGVIGGFILSIILNTQIFLLFKGYWKRHYYRNLSFLEASLCCGEAGEKEKESTWGMMGREKRGRYYIMCASLAKFFLWVRPSQLTIWMLLDAVVQIIV